MVNLANASDISITVSSDPKTIGITESLNLRISVNIKGTEEAESPSFDAKDFRIVAQSNSTNIITTFINGKLIPKRTDAYTYTLLPKKLGNLSITQIIVKIDGESYKAEDQKILVQKGPILSPPPPSLRPGDADPKRKARQKRNVFDITLELSKKKVYLGEAINVKYKLVSKKRMNQIHITKWPSFDGFWKEDLFIPNRYSFQRKIINEEILLESFLASFAIYPLKTGEVKVDSLEVEGTFLAENTNPFGGNFYSFFSFQGLRKATKRSKARFIEVLPLPEDGKPDSFSGVVGNFSIALNVAKKKVKTDEAINFEFIVVGEGNFQSINRPNIEFPESFEVYESNNKTKSKNSQGISKLQKQKTFSIIIIPRERGIYNIPPIRWSYFDVKEEKYKTLVTKPLTITVKGKRLGSGTKATVPKETKDEIKTSFKTTTQDNLRYLKIKTEVLKESGLSIKNIFSNLNKILILIIGLLLASMLYKALLSQLKRFKKKGRKENLILVMKKLGTMVKKNKLNYGQLESTLTQLQNIFLEEETQGITQKEMRLAWEKKKLPRVLLDTILEIKQLCDSRQYSSQSTQEQKEKFFHSIEKVLELTEKQL